MDGMLMVMNGMDVTLVVEGMVERAVSRMIGRYVLIFMILFSAVEVALIRVIIGLKELNNSHIDVLLAHAVRLVDSGCAAGIQVLSHGDTVFAVEELGDGDLVVKHVVVHSLAIEQEVSDGGFHEFGHGDIVRGEVLRDGSLVGGKELGDGDIEELSNRDIVGLEETR